MSTTSKITLLACTVTSVGIIYYVHYQQNFNRDQLRLGVLKDIERQKKRQLENLSVLEQQARLTEELQKNSTRS